MNWLKRILLVYLIKKIGRNSTVKKIVEWLKGKRTIITAIIAGVCVTLERLGIDIPVWVYEILTVLGVTFVKMGLNRIEKALNGKKTP